MLIEINKPPSHSLSLQMSTVFLVSLVLCFMEPSRILFLVIRPRVYKTLEWTLLVSGQTGTNERRARDNFKIGVTRKFDFNMCAQ